VQNRRDHHSKLSNSKAEYDHRVIAVTIIAHRQFIRVSWRTRTTGPDEAAEPDSVTILPARRQILP
jgi:hypothetical protein